MVELETARLKLREFTIEDVPAMAAFDKDPEMMRYIGRGVTYTVEETAAGIRRIIEHYARHGYGMYAVVYKATGEVIGRCGFKFWDEIGQTEIGWIVAKSFWGQGIASEAASTILDAGFEQHNFEEIIAIIDRPNLASSSVAKKLGMTFDREIDFGYKKSDCYKIERAEFFRRKATTH